MADQKISIRLGTGQLTVGVRLILDPANGGDVSGWYERGAVPFRVWHQLERVVLDVRYDVLAEELQEWLEADEQQARLAVIVAAYRGQRWDGSNHVGQWADDEHEDEATSPACVATEELQVAFDRAAENGDFCRGWAAGDWFQGTPWAVQERLSEGATVPEIVEELQHEADLERVFFTDDLEEYVNGEQKRYAERCAEIEELGRAAGELAAQDCLTADDLDSGDWDVAAWAEDSAHYGLHGGAATIYWPIYESALRAAWASAGSEE